MAGAVRAKFRVDSITKHSWNPTAVTVKLVAVMGGSPENLSFAKTTPSGTIEMQVDNPPAAEVLALGKTFYVDFTPAE